MSETNISSGIEILTRETILMRMFRWTYRKKGKSLRVITPCHYKSNYNEHWPPTVNVKGRSKVRETSLYTVKDAICQCSASHYRL